jgi:hypothetical protein
MIEQQCLNGAGLLTAQGGPHCISTRDAVTNTFWVILTVSNSY